VTDFRELLRSLGEWQIYRIARIAVMRDDMFALHHPDIALKNSSGQYWQDSIGSYWLDPAAPEVVEYAIKLGVEAKRLGFDEVQYDYVRFPSDGRLNAINYPVYDGQQSKIDIMQKFFGGLTKSMSDNKIPVSFDLFGMTFIVNDDFEIGQRLIDAFPNADFISPMAYPSHYSNGFRGHSNPALAPYDVVNGTLESGIEILSSELSIDSEAARPKIRPWLQDFDLGAIYTSDMIEAEIAAARDAGASGWLLWNARNVYEEADYTAGSEDKDI
jgi:hypothetical protein